MIAFGTEKRYNQDIVMKDFYRGEETMKAVQRWSKMAAALAACFLLSGCGGQETERRISTWMNRQPNRDAGCNGLFGLL